MYKKIAMTLTTAFLVSGCGGGDSSSPTSTSTITGQFVDAAVSGLEYKCSSGTEGVTDIQGYFTCNQNDEVSFSINGFKIGSAKAQELVTPLSLAPDDNTTVANIAQLLQTLDSDNDPSNGISINNASQEVIALSNLTVSVDAVDFDSVVESYIGTSLVEETTAMEHLDLSVKNAVNNTGITSTSSVIIRKNITQEMCLSTFNNDTTFDGYGTYEEFINAGGSAVAEFYSGDKSCSEYSTAGYCQEAVLPDIIDGEGSCIAIVTYPEITTVVTTLTENEDVKPLVLAYSYSADSDYTIEYLGNDISLSITNSDVSLINIKDGSLLWKYTPSEYTRSIKLIGITNKKVILGVSYSIKNTLEYLDRDDGTLLNSAEVDSVSTFKKLNEDGSLLLTDETVVNSDGTTLFNIAGRLYNTVVNDTTIVSLNDEKLYAYDFNGNQLWESNVRCNNNLMIDTANIYCTQNIDRNTTELTSISLDDGTISIQKNFDIINSLKQTEDMIYMITGMWKEDGTFHQRFFSLEKGSLLEKWSVNTYGKVAGVDTSKNLVYLTDDAGELKTYNTNDGILNFSIDLNLSSYVMDFKIDDNGNILVKDYRDGNYEYKVYKYE